MATVLRSSAAAARRLLLLSRAGYASFSTVGSASSRVIPAVVSSDRFSGSILPFSWNPSRFVHSSAKHLPEIQDPEIESAFKDLMATNWGDIPQSVVNEAKKALSKETNDKEGQEHLKSLFRAAEACEEFSGTLVSLRMALDDLSGTLVSLRMALDDLSGLSGENVGPLPEYLLKAVKAAHDRYVNYLNSFDASETYLKKKVETELGTKMIHLKMRCSGIGSEWGKVTLLGTSGISGSYVELRA